MSPSRRSLHDLQHDNDHHPRTKLPACQLLIPGSPLHGLNPGSLVPSRAQPRTGSRTHLWRDLLAAGMQKPRHPFHLLPPPVSHILSALSLGISNMTRPQGHNTLEVQPRLRPWEPQGHHPCVRRSYTALGWAVSPRGLPESERPGGKGWRRTIRDPAAPDAEENRPRKANSLGAGCPVGAGPLPMALLSAPSSGRLSSPVNLTSQPGADWFHSSPSKVLWPQARLP